MKHLYFIRHGESEANVAGVSSGHLDTPLTAKGRKQAYTAGLHATEKRLVFDAIISSPLQRAHHTAQSIAEQIDYPKSKIEIHDILIERNHGALDGKNNQKFTGLTPEEWYKNPLAADHIDGIEKIAELHNRAKNILEYIKSRPEESILIVSHNALGRSIYRVVKGLKFDEPIQPLKNAEYIKLI